MMRLRGKPWAAAEVQDNPLRMAEPEQYKGKWQTVFGNENGICIEIGCGKGQFINETARRNPQMNFIAIEREQKIIAMAMKSARSGETLPANLRFIWGDAQKLNEYFADGELSRVYINFCDPWRNRVKWHKRRLTHHNYLAVYARLSTHGELFFKTDSEDLFRFSCRELRENGWTLRNTTDDLHNSTYAADNVMTEYETRFHGMGMPVYRLEAEVQINTLGTPSRTL